MKRWLFALCAAGLMSGLPAFALELEDVAREGELRFLAQRPDPDAYAYEARVDIDDESLRTGLVTIHTCHRKLDPNRRVVVLFNRERVQTIDITERSGIQGAWVDGHRVELASVERGGHVCIALRSRALDATADGQWTLSAGPLMRRYLDGYLPMEAVLHVRWPAGLLHVRGTDPDVQPGVQLQQRTDGATLQVVFAGRLSAKWRLARGLV
jgi:hypothetical protein